jgi:hypothetical protein
VALELGIGDLVRMRKPHPCGDSVWQVTRLGADIGLVCQKCHHYILLPRAYLGRRIKEVISVVPPDAEELTNG